MKRLFAPVALLCALVLASGCGDPHGVNKTANRVRVANGLVGPTNVNVSSSHGLASVNNLGFGQVTQYVSGPFGNTTVTVTDANTGATVAGPTTVAQVVDESQTIIISGIVGGTGVMAPKITILYDNYPTATTPTGDIPVRFVNLSPDSPPLSLYATPSTIPGQFGDDNVGFGLASPYSLGMTGTNGLFVMAVYNQASSNPTLVSTNLNTQGYDITTTGGAISVFLFGMMNPGAGQPSLQTVITPDNGTVSYTPVMSSTPVQ